MFARCYIQVPSLARGQAYPLIFLFYFFIVIVTVIVVVITAFIIAVKR